MITRYSTCAILAALCVLATAIRVMAAETPFGITNEANRHLWTVYVMNQFDSAWVEYQFGEVQLMTASGSQFVDMRVALDDYLAGNMGRKIPGQTATGIDSTLLPHGHSKTFTVPPSGGSVQVTRDFVAYTCYPIDYDRGSGPGDTNLTSWTDARWWVGADRIMDRSDIMIDVVDEASGDVLGTIDSVTSMPNPMSNMAIRGGTAVDSTVIVRTLPASAHGKDVYLRVRIRRTGPTPYGVVMRKMWDATPLSRTLGFRPLPVTPTQQVSWDDQKKAHNDSVYAQFFDELMAYAMAYADTTGCSPRIPNLHAFPEAYATIMQQWEESEGLIVDTTGRCSNYSNATALWYRSTMDGGPFPKGSAEKPYVDPSKRAHFVIERAFVNTSKALEFDLSADKSLRPRADVYTSSGVRVRSGELGELRGRGNYTTDISNLASGVYVLVVVADNGGQQSRVFNIGR